MAWYDWCNWETLAEGFKGLGRLITRASTGEYAMQYAIAEKNGVDTRSEYDKLLDGWTSRFTGRDEISEKKLVANFDKVDITLEKLNEIKTKKVEAARTEVSKELAKIQKIKGIECINNNIRANSADEVFNKIQESIDQIMQQIRENADSIMTYQKSSNWDKFLGTVAMTNGKIVEGFFEVFENIDDALLGSVALCAHIRGKVAGWMGFEEDARVAFYVRDTASDIAKVNAVHDTLDDMVYSNVKDYSQITEDSLVASGYEVFGSVMGYTIISLGGNTIVSPGSLSKTVSISGQEFKLMTSRRAVDMYVAGTAGYGSGFSNSLNMGDDFETAQGKGFLQGTVQASVVYAVEGVADNIGAIKNLVNGEGGGIAPNTTETGLTVQGTEPGTGTSPGIGTEAGTSGSTAPGSVGERLSNNVDDFLAQVNKGTLTPEEIAARAKDLSAEINSSAAAKEISKQTQRELLKLVHPDKLSAVTMGVENATGDTAASVVSSADTAVTSTAGETVVGTSGAVSGTESTALSTVTTGTAGDTAGVISRTTGETVAGTSGSAVGAETTSLSQSYARSTLKYADEALSSAEKAYNSAQNTLIKAEEETAASIARVGEEGSKDSIRSLALARENAAIAERNYIGVKNEIARANQIIAGEGSNLPAVIDNSTKGLPAVIDNSTRGLPAVIDNSTRGLPAVVEEAAKVPPSAIESVVKPSEIIARTLNATGNKIGEGLAQDAINQRKLIEPINNVTNLLSQDPDVTLLDPQTPSITSVTPNPNPNPDPIPVQPQPDPTPVPPQPDPTPVTPKDLVWEEVEIANNKPQPTRISVEVPIASKEPIPSTEPSYTPSEPTYSGSGISGNTIPSEPNNTPAVTPSEPPTPVEPEPTVNFEKGNTYTKIPTSTISKVETTTSGGGGNSAIPILAGISAAAAAGIGAKAYMSRKKNTDNDSEIETEEWSETNSYTDSDSIDSNADNGIDTNVDIDAYKAMPKSEFEELSDDIENEDNLEEYKYSSRNNDELVDFSLEGDENNE